VKSDRLAAQLDEIAISGQPVADQPRDVLAEALHYLRMDGMFYCRSELTGPWGIELPAMPEHLWFHVMVSGSCVLVNASGQRMTVRAGDVVILPHGAGHRAFDVEDAPTPSVFDLPHDYVSETYAVLRHGGDGAVTNIICGVVQLAHPAAQALVAGLPAIIRADGSSLLDLIEHETMTARPGGETVITRLCDVLVIQAIRGWIDSDPAAQTGWLGALRDPAIGAAIGLIHDDPSVDWTIAGLAQRVGMSRSGFSARFSALVAIPPMAYITQWRMSVAEDMLRNESTSVFAIATALGYQSEAAFSRAFKRETGRPPSHVRRDATSMSLQS